MRRRASIITILDNSNIGTYLQAYSLASVLSGMGLDAECINYIRPSRSLLADTKERVIRERGWARKLLTVFYGLFVGVVARHKAMMFLRKRVSVGKKCVSFEEIRRKTAPADFYITGSDQVWNYDYNKGLDKAYFLDFAPDDAVRFSYAASIGMDHIPEEFKLQTRLLLEKYQFLSVREDSARTLLTELGFNHVEMVLDPTLLLSWDAWSDVAGNDSHLAEEKYLLVYSVECSRSKTVAAVAQRLAKKKGLKIYYLTPRWFASAVDADKSFYFASPQQFLRLFKYASYAVVSSFHGTVFSLNFGVPFISVAPERFNSRVNSLLSMAGLRQRIVQDELQIDGLLDEAIDFDDVQGRLAKERESSLAYLRNACSINDEPCTCS